MHMGVCLNCIDLKVATLFWLWGGLLIKEDARWHQCILQDFFFFFCLSLLIRHPIRQLEGFQMHLGWGHGDCYGRIVQRIPTSDTFEGFCSIDGRGATVWHSFSEILQSLIFFFAITT